MVFEFHHHWNSIQTFRQSVFMELKYTAVYLKLKEIKARLRSA